MVNVDNAIIARLKTQGQNFEILVDCSSALALKEGKIVDMHDVMAAMQIFSDAHKGLAASETAMKQIFGTGDSEEIAKQSAEMLANKLKKIVVVEDSGFFIKALNDFPGTCSAYIHKRIGLQGIIKLMKGIKDRECTYKSAVAYCKPGKKAISFLGEENGMVAESTRGFYGFGHDPIFIPESSDKTYGEIKNCEESKKFRRRAVLKLREYLLKKR